LRKALSCQLGILKGRIPRPPRRELDMAICDINGLDVLTALQGHNL
jgi:hypothetical protein